MIKNHQNIINNRIEQNNFYEWAMVMMDQEAKKGPQQPPELPTNFVEKFPGGFVVFRVEGKRLSPLYLSDNWCKMMGNTRERLMDLYAENALNSVHPEDLPWLSQRVEKAVENRLPMNLNYRVNNGNGEYRWVNQRGSFVTTADGNANYYAVYLDITPEMEARQKQQEARQELMAVMDHTNIMFWEYDIRKGSCINGFKSIRDLNMPPVMENYPECVIESGFIHAEYAQEFRMAHQKLKEGVPHLEISIKVNEPGGGIAWKKVKYTTFFGKDGKPLRALGTSEDITEQKYAEERYRQSEKFRQSLYEKALGSFKMNLTQNRFMTGDRVLSRIADSKKYQTADSVLEYAAGRCIDQQAEEKFRAVFSRKALLEAFENGQNSVSLEHIFVTGQNKQIWGKTTVEMIRNPENSDVEAIIYAMDITQQKNKEILINGVVSAEFDFITQINAATGYYTMYTQNREGLELPALTGEDFYQKNVEFIYRYVAEDEIERCIEESKIENMVARLDREGDYFTYYRSRNPDGSIGHKKLHIFYSDQKTKMICLVRTDITRDYQEREKKNEALEEALTLAEHSNQAKSSFLSRMSHDIRTPMNAIMGMTELAKQEIDHPDKVMESLTVIEQASQHLLNIINDILDMSLIESGNTGEIKEPFDLAAQIVSIQEIMAILLAEKKQSFQLTQSLHHKHYMGDAVRLKRVLLNLLNNASKFTAEGGAIKLEIEEKASTNPHISLVKFSVEDNGCGIPEDKLETIFTPFSRLENSMQSEGTGLGLSIVKGIIEAKGGTIHVKSKVGSGSVFTVILPLEIDESYSAEKEECPTQAAPKANELSGMHILLVEDHPINAKVAKRMLESCGAAVDTAENGSLGYQKFSQSPAGAYDLIFMDIQMPVLNGYEATRKIRACAHPQAKSIPIVAMTANAYADDIDKSIECGMNGHIAKPISMNQLLRAIKSIKQENGGFCE